MATTAFGAGDFDAALKKVIQPYIQDNVPSQTKLLQVIKKNDNVEFFNNYFYAPLRSNRHGGVVNLANDKTILRTGSATTVQAYVTPKILTGTFDISDVIAKASANDRGAVESAMTYQMKTLKTDFAKSINRQYHSDGVGVIAEAGSVGAGTLSVVYPSSSVDDGRVTSYYGPINYDIKPTKYFAVGQGIGIGTAGADFGTIAAVTGGTAQGTLVVTGAPAIVANDSVYITDAGESAAGTSEIQGIRAALSEGTADYAGLARSTADVWSPQFAGTAANAALAINDMEIVYMSAVEYAQDGDRYAWFMNKTLYTKYGDLLTALRRTVNKTELVSGWSGLSFEAGQGDVGVFLDFDTPDGDAVLLNLDTWTVCQVAPMGFVEDNTLRRSDYITFQKVFSWYTNLLCVAPGANGRLVRRTK
uniref:Putative structural protein n=1 Tax=viral metagenome TaxID=1070528 RepID=A0A6M3KVM4_9ZZZZ